MATGSCRLRGVRRRPFLSGLQGHEDPGLFDIDMRRCPRCGAGQVKLIAAILERAVIGKILTHLGLDPQPPPRSKAREAGLEFAA